MTTLEMSREATHSLSWFPKKHGIAACAEIFVFTFRDGLSVCVPHRKRSSCATQFELLDLEQENRAPQATSASILLGARLGWKSLLGFKVGYWAMLLCLVWFFPRMDIARFNTTMPWPPTGGPTFGSYFATWDGSHYLFLSESGYVHGAASCAFYPLLPFLIRAFSFFTLGDHLLAGLIVCNVASLFGWFLFHRLVAERFDQKTATLALVLLLAYPGALFFQFVYSESLCFLLLMILWWGLQRKRWGVVLAASVLVVLARPVGIFCVVPLTWHLWRNRVPWRQWWCATGPLLGWVAYFLVMKALTGNPWEGFDAQKYFNTHSVANFLDLPKFLDALIQPTAWHNYRGSFLDRAFVVLLISCLPVIWKLDQTLFWWAVCLGVLPAITGTFASSTRFVTLAFPMFIALGALLCAPERWIARMVILAAFAGLHLWLLFRHINFKWAG
jgi:hypothetical protein